MTLQYLWWVNMSMYEKIYYIYDVHVKVNTLCCIVCMYVCMLYTNIWCTTKYSNWWRQYTSITRHYILLPNMHSKSMKSQSNTVNQQHFLSFSLHNVASEFKQATTRIWVWTMKCVIENMMHVNFDWKRSRITQNSKFQLPEIAFEKVLISSSVLLHFANFFHQNIR